MELNLDLLARSFPQTKRETLAKFVEPLNKVCVKYRIDTVNRLSSFLAQVGHESGAFNFTIENLNYSQQALIRVFPRYFPTAALAAAYARQPMKIASRVYGGRMGNGSEATGDGWKFRGRGLIQLTGKTNVTAFATSMKMTIDEAIAYLETPEGACMSAGWFWEKNNLNMWADKADIQRQTKIINGGLNGIEDRLHHFHVVKKNILAARG